MHCPDDNWLITLSAFFQHRKEMILRAQLAHQRIAAKQANLTYPPVTASGVQHPIGQERLMRTMKGTKTEMDDTGA